MSVSLSQVIGIVKAFCGKNSDNSGSAEPTSWHDLTDRPFYSGYEEDGRCAGTVTTSGGYLEFDGVYDVLTYETGYNYTVIWDGVEYPGLEYHADGYGGTFCTGEEPFNIYSDSEGYLMSWNDDAEHTVTIIRYAETVVETLPEKYLPDALTKPVVFRDRNSVYSGTSKYVVFCDDYTSDEVLEIARSYYKSYNSNAPDRPLPIFMLENSYTSSTSKRPLAVFIGVHGMNTIVFLEANISTNDTRLITIKPYASTNGTYPGAFIKETYILPSYNAYGTDRPFLTYESGIPAWSATITPVIADSSGAKWKLVVGTDGTLTTEAVT